MKALIFAAGLGTRLRPLTDTMPKAMVCLAGKPLIWHLLRKLATSGVSEVIVNTHHFADMLETCAKSVGREVGVDIKISDEREFLRDTGGGLQHARRFFEGENGFLLHNVDIVSDLDLRWLEGAALPDSLATLVVSERKSSRYLLFDEQMNMRGWTDERSGEVRSPYSESELSGCRKLAFSGIHYVRPAVFEAFEALGFEGKFSIIDFYIQACKDYKIRAALPQGGLRITDVGKIESLQAAEKQILNI